ncbi:hypothetical protein EG329_012149 [Mollisiaceae sp. DMI_Dod_QoI]|nr:hypothetical protein EG329_012149 [Helotiales sp. DMI_Dod_QoI]
MEPFHETPSRASAISFSTQVQNPLQAERPLVLPENRLSRTVPAHVHRRANANTRALPPPSVTQKPKSGEDARPEKGKGRKVNHSGDNIDSDSYNDRNKRRHTDDSDAPVSRRKAASIVPDVGPSGHNSSASSSLTPEEQQRVQLRAELQTAEEKWKKFKLDREECASRQSNRQHSLTKEKRRRCTRSNELERIQMWKSVEEEDNRLRDFYDEVLSSHIEQQLHEDTENEEHEEHKRLNSCALADDIVSNLEDKIIVGFQDYEPYDLSHNGGVMPLNKKNRMIAIFDSIQTSLMGRIGTPNNPWKSIKDLVLGSMIYYYSSIYTACAERSEDAPAHQYLDALSKRLVEVLTRVKPSVSGHTPSYVALGPSSDVSATRAADWGEFIDQERWKLWKVSREQNEHRYLDMRKKLLGKFRNDFSHVCAGQEFLENLNEVDQPGEVFLVLLKDDMLASVQAVSPENLTWLGWRRASPTENYWRYSRAGDPSDLFKVQMDGEVVGIWTLDGDINWEEEQ